MRKRIIAMLDFARQLVHAEMDLFECPHDGNFDSGDKVCKECIDGPECQWLYATDALAALGSRSINQLSEALEFAIISVAASAIDKDHNPQRCRCPICRWLSQAEALQVEIQRG